MTTAWPFKGPRGGRYRVNSKGRKVYDKPKTSERKFADDGQSIRGLQLAAERARDEAAEKPTDWSGLVFFHGFIWLLAILCGWGWGHGVLFPFNAVWASFSGIWAVSQVGTAVLVAGIGLFFSLPFLKRDFS